MNERNPGGHMQGVVFIIDQLGQTVMKRDATIAQLQAENEQLKAQLAAQKPVTDYTEGDQP